MKLQELKCPNCTGPLTINSDNETLLISCLYCGQQFFLDNEKKEYVINQNIITRHTDDADVIRAETEANESKHSLRNSLIVLLVVLSILSLTVFFIFNMPEILSEKNEGKINAGSYSDLIGKDYKTVEAHFESAGFTNIELIDLNDSGIAFWTEGKVETISIGGNTKFESIEWFDPETKVVISYH